MVERIICFEQYDGNLIFFKVISCLWMFLWCSLVSTTSIRCIHKHLQQHRVWIMNFMSLWLCWDGWGLGGWDLEDRRVILSSESVSDTHTSHRSHFRKRRQRWKFLVLLLVQQLHSPFTGQCEMRQWLHTSHCLIFTVFNAPLSYIEFYIHFYLAGTFLFSIWTILFSSVI